MAFLAAPNQGQDFAVGAEPGLGEAPAFRVGEECQGRPKLRVRQGRAIGGAIALYQAFVDAQAALGLARYLSGDANGAKDIWIACREQRPKNARIEAYLAMLERTVS